MLEVNAFGNTTINWPGCCTTLDNEIFCEVSNGGGIITVSDGSHIFLSLQYRGTNNNIASLNCSLWSSGIPYLHQTILLAQMNDGVSPVTCMNIRVPYFVRSCVEVFDPRQAVGITVPATGRVQHTDV